MSGGLKALTPIACTLQLTRRCAGHRIAGHARFANVDTLVQLLAVIRLVLTYDASPLPIGVFGFTGASGQKHGSQQA